MHGVARLLGNPWRDGVDQLAVEEDHLEEHHRALYDEHLNYCGDVLLLHRVGYDLYAGEASRDEQEEERPQQRRHYARIRIEPSKAAENFNQRRLQGEGKDRRFDRAPYGEDHERDPRYTGLEVAPRRPVKQRERRANNAQHNVFEHQQAEAHRADNPPNERDTDAQHPRPKQPNHSAGIPPLHEQPGEESAATRAEGDRVQRKGCAPHTR